MKYPEFKDSALKHLKTCQCLILNIKHCEKNKKYILPSIYYLSGYILKTILKYEIFHSINYDKKKDIENLNQENMKFRDIKIHNLSILKRILETKARSSTRLENYEQNKVFFEKWEHQIRYKKSKDIIEEEVYKFFEFSKKNFYNITFRR